MYAIAPPCSFAVGPILQCPELELNSFGHSDGEKRYCGASGDFTNCTILSFGSAGDFTFETEIFHRTKCSVEIFDCTGTWEVPSSIAPRVRIHKYCVAAGTNTDPLYLSWPALMAKLGLARTKYVKMDIEGFEYEVLYEMVMSLPPHLLPETIALEIHGPWTGVGLHIALFFDYLFRYGGYIVLDKRDASTCCTEIILARVFN